MSIPPVGTIAFDAVTTPFGARAGMLGGSAVHFALAASFFDTVHVVGPVGDDFGEQEYSVLRDHDVDVQDIEHVAGGKTFFWRGEYGWDLSERETLDTQLGVFAGFEPRLSEQSRAADLLFLANIQPQLLIDQPTVGQLFAPDKSVNIARCSSDARRSRRFPSAVISWLASKSFDRRSSDVGACSASNIHRRVLRTTLCGAVRHRGGNSLQYWTLSGHNV